MFEDTVGTKKITVPKFPLPHQAPLRRTTFIEGITDVLQVLILLATLVWTIVKIANALKEFCGGGLEAG